MPTFVAARAAGRSPVFTHRDVSLSAVGQAQPLRQNAAGSGAALA